MCIRSRCAGGDKKKKKKKRKTKKKKVEQTEPPTVGLTKLFPDGKFPEGELQEYKDEWVSSFRFRACGSADADWAAPASNAYRTTSEEKRYAERIAMEDPETTYNSIRRGAEVHRQVRQYARRVIRPGMRMVDIADTIENGVRALVEGDGLDAGIAFPTGLSLNHCAAHYSPNPGDTLGECRVRAGPQRVF